MGVKFEVPWVTPEDINVSEQDDDYQIKAESFGNEQRYLRVTIDERVEQADTKQVLLLTATEANYLAHILGLWLDVNGGS
jgi:HSP20 family molecular chaperone IbpA